MAAAGGGVQNSVVVNESFARQAFGNVPAEMEGEGSRASILRFLVRAGVDPESLVEPLMEGMRYE